MIGRKFRYLAAVPLSITGTAVLGVTSTTPPSGVETVRAEVALMDDVSLIVGGNGNPVPSPDYMNTVTNLYIDPHFPGFTPQPVITPASLSPFTGVRGMPLDQSAAIGQAALNQQIMQQLGEGNHVVVQGFNQGAQVASQELNAFAAMPPGEAPTANELSFVLTDNPMTPNGGFDERFGDPIQLDPAIQGQTFYGATTPDTIYPTDNYTLEYDGFADYPRYPLNLLADLNASLGQGLVAPEYNSLTPEQISANEILLPGSAELTGIGTTNYYMLPVDGLPLLEPLRAIPGIGNPLADLLQPDLTALINLGYGDPDYGWSTSPANVPTPAGLFPSFDEVVKTIEQLGPDTMQGINNAIADITSGGQAVGSMTDAIQPMSVQELLASLPPLLLPQDVNEVGDPLPELTHIINTLGVAVAHIFENVVPLVEFPLTDLLDVPNYDLQLFLSELQSVPTTGFDGLVNAIDLPIAEDVGLISATVLPPLLSTVQSVAESAIAIGGLF